MDLFIVIVTDVHFSKANGLKPVKKQMITNYPNLNHRINIHKYVQKDLLTFVLLLSFSFPAYTNIRTRNKNMTF